MDAASRARRADQIEPLAVHFATKVEPPSSWSPAAVEAALGLTLPGSIKELWSGAHSIRLFEDVTYGQWGLSVLSPDDAIVSTQLQTASRKSESRPGDLVVGTFIGDSDVLLLRCDEKAEDYGTIVVSLPIYSRSDWPVVGRSLEQFLLDYIACSGEKFWD